MGIIVKDEEIMEVLQDMWIKNEIEMQDFPEKSCQEGNTMNLLKKR